MAEQDLDQLTDSFFTTKTYGPGMGLSIVDRIVKAHGGRFEFRKQEIGLEVKVLLPIQAQAAGPLAPEPPAAA